jgi:hypothetical protein
MWKEILAAVLPPVIAALMAGVPALLEWLKSQKWVQTLHLEDFLSAVIPQALEWVEWWSVNIFEPKYGRKPSSEEKLAKAVLHVESKLPKGVTVAAEEIALRVETALATAKKNGGLVTAKDGESE